MHVRSRRKVVLLLFIFVINCYCKADAEVLKAGIQEVSPPFAQIEKLNAEIFVLECAILKIDTYLRLEHGKQPKGRRWRMAYYQTTNYACTFAGLLVNMIYNFYYYPRGGHATTIAQLGATTPRFVGKAVYLSGLTFETILQIMEHYKEKREGFDTTQIRKRVLVLQKALDDAIARREKLLASIDKSVLSTEEQSVLDHDSKLITESRNLILQEYCMLDARAVSISTRNKLYNSLTWVKKADADFGADLVRIIGGITHNAHLNSPASMSTTLSGSMSAFDPWVEMCSERITYKLHKKAMAKIVNLTDNINLPEFERTYSHANEIDRERIIGKDSMLGTLLDKHNHFYRGIASSYDSMNYLRENELKAEERHDIHSIVYHAIYGSSKLSRGAWLIYVGFRYLNGPGHSKHSALLNGFAGIDNFSGSAYRLADFLTCDYLAIKNRKRDNLKSMARVAMMRARLDILDSMEDDARDCFQAASNIH